MQPPQGMNQHRGAAQMHKLLRAPPDFPLNAGEKPPLQTVKKADLPSLSDLVYPVLLDVDPEQGVEDEYKNKHNSLFCWRMLRQISQVALTCFSAEQKIDNKPNKIFEGNIEEQAKILCKSFMKKKIMEAPPAPPSEDNQDDPKQRAETSQQPASSTQEAQGPSGSAPDVEMKEENGQAEAKPNGEAAPAKTDTPAEAKAGAPAAGCPTLPILAVSRQKSPPRKTAKS